MFRKGWPYIDGRSSVLMKNQQFHSLPLQAHFNLVEKQLELNSGETILASDCLKCTFSDSRNRVKREMESNTPQKGERVSASTERKMQCAN